MDIEGNDTRYNSTYELLYNLPKSLGLCQPAQSTSLQPMLPITNFRVKGISGRLQWSVGKYAGGQSVITRSKLETGLMYRTSPTSKRSIPLPPIYVQSGYIKNDCLNFQSQMSN